ncbi:MAG: type III-B CRISPR-associated protein Cas10/Cmr2 [Polyangia bacterium]
MGSTEWRKMAIAFLHDPPDKALDIRSHERRALEWIQATGFDANETDLTQAKNEDIKASTEDRLPLPDAGKKPNFKLERSVSFTDEAAPNERLLVRHPLSGQCRTLDDADGYGDWLESEPVDGLLSMVRELDSDEARLMALWRFLPERLAEIDPQLEHLPADTRTPDHTICNHLDLSAAFQMALADGRGGALLAFSLGPVQGFIAQAKSLRDLWSGSYILSWLAFAAMKPILERCGPAALVFPGLRANPLCDRWLKQRYPGPPFDDLLSGDDERKALLQGALPNTFVALVPAGEVEDLNAACKESCRKAWREIARAVHGELHAAWQGKVDLEWDTGWEEQIEGFWDLRAASAPLRPGGQSSKKRLQGYFGEFLWGECWPSKATDDLQATLKKAGQAYRERDDMPPGSWAMHNELLGRLMAATKAIRHVPPHSGAGGDRPKCTMMGSLEQMGPGGAQKQQADFWKIVANEENSIRGTHVRRSERLSAVALVKRFAWSCFFAKELGFEATELRYSDTATVAARKWFKEAVKEAPIDPDEIREKHGDWSGQWLFQDPRSWDREADADDPDRDPPPPKTVRKTLASAILSKDTERPRPYYAVFALDGDEMGKWLRGDKAPTLRETYHPKMVRHLESLEGGRAAMEGRRPLSPAQHAAMTAALGHFARELVPRIVDRHQGELVYAGGDDALAVLPTDEAIGCLRELRAAYSGRGAGDERMPEGWELAGDGRRILTMMGDRASASAGLAVAHFKTDLREVLDAARAAEKLLAKEHGRDALGIKVLKRSGERMDLLCPWGFAETFEQLVGAFACGASDRWAYRLRQEEETLNALPVDAARSALKRAVDHGDQESRKAIADALGIEKSKEAGDGVAKRFERFRELLDERGLGQDAFSRFVKLVQAASFLARGRDDR